MTSKKLVNSTLLGAADQAVLSAFSLAIGVAFLKFATKTEYGAYALMTAVLLLAQSIQNASVSSPLTTLLPGTITQRDQDLVMSASVRVQSWLLATTLVIGAVGLLVSVSTGNGRGVLICALVLGIAGILSREFARARYYLRRDALGALTTDAVYVLLAGCAVIGILLLEKISAALVVAALGLVGITTAALAGVRFQWPFESVTDDERRHLQRIWDCARWALPSVLNNWLYANAYLFIVEALISKEAVADLSASRLLLVPLSLLVVGWSNVFRPRASAWFAQGEIVKLESVAKRSVIVFIIVGLFYAIGLYSIFSIVENLLLSNGYQNLAPIISLWTMFFIVSAFRSIGMACILSTHSGFKTMYKYSWIGIFIALPGVLIASEFSWIPGVVLSLLVSEVVLAISVWFTAWRSMKRAAK